MRQLSLLGPGELRLDPAAPEPLAAGEHIRLKVHYCAICRTDAKMWQQGHRDLALPRVPGHELVGMDEAGSNWYALWPGQVCGECWYCRNQRENLCDRMRITGFHRDGGFADYLVVPRSSLLPLPPTERPYLFCFAEPLGCVFNAFSALSLGQGRKIIIYGGGVLGLLAALVAAAEGAEAVVVEQSAEKIAKAEPLLADTPISICKETVESDFDCAINCCDSVAAFSLCLSKLRKGGQLAYFSGVRKDDELNFNLLNLIHYRELEVFGSYGPKRADLARAVDFCAAHQGQLSQLVEALVPPEQAPELMAGVLSSTPFKYIIDFSQAASPDRGVGPVAVKGAPARAGSKTLPPLLQDLVKEIHPVDQELRTAAQRKIDLKTKPLGALGKIEDLAVSLSVIQGSLQPVVSAKKILVFAGDHGVAEEGVSAYPAKVTLQMVENFLAGGAAINVFCGHYGIELAVVDMGVKGELAPHPLLVEKKVARGTKNFALERAMSPEEALRSIEYGAQVVGRSGDGARSELLGLGEMGIANSSAATAVISAVTGIDPAELTGRGTGIDNQGLKRKVEAVRKGLAYHRPDPSDGLDILSKVGGYELGGICGAVLAAAGNGSCLVLDGLISTAAGLLAYLLCPEIAGYLVSAHRSVEPGQQAALEFMGLEPVVDLEMRLGEGTGAAITIHLLELAAGVMCEMASFSEAGIAEPCQSSPSSRLQSPLSKR
ncbi:nicotinate-nucleotide--dimethylbenzimidazole phosphoribosyltransferase [Desulfogranum mediterraneum]|uniref:nicotinate-nucleotide--dimethylbenzimidazole phosphoribosyltransferase n=1 Tax=Desulfogranum mediterraneum TaxID=160661 RepID=UPI0003F5E2C5|nr:nicotinate-nucleotide--dimethylbenzimidazole phosphoribosyltransferase [Desulfogranum mediterraneum]